jgi:hypothetical protein
MFFYSLKVDIIREINENARYLKYSVDENDCRWKTLYKYTWSNYEIMGNYPNEVQSLKNWLNERFEWLEVEFNNM